MAARAVGALVQEEVLPPLEDPTGIDERADDLLELKRHQMPLRGEEGAVAGVMDDARAETVDGVRAEHLIDLRRGDARIEDVDALAAEAGVDGEIGGEGELVAEADTTPRPRFGPIIERPGVVGRARR